MKISPGTALLLVLAALSLSLAAWAVRRGVGVEVEVSPARRELAEAVGPVRPSEGRLTGGFAYVRYTPEGAALKSPRRLKGARERIERALKREGSPQSFADAGVLHLLGGQTDKAVALLEQATKRGSADAGIWSDLAAAHLARYGMKGNFTDLLDALQAAERATKASPNHPEARFNLGLALDRLSLRWRARAAWSQYRDLDGHSEWTREAESRFAAFFQPSYSDLWIEHRAAFEQVDLEPAEIGALAKKLVQHFPQQAREMVEEDLLGRWAMQRSQHHLTEAERTLGIAKAVGSALADLRGEYIIADAVRAIEVASGGEEAQVLDQIISGYTHYQRGLEMDRSEEFEIATQHFEAAGGSLAIAESPSTLSAWLRLAVCEGQLFDYTSAMRRLDSLRGARDLSRYPALHARILWISGLYHVIRGHPAESLAAYRHAWEIFGRLGEQENRAAISNLLAETHRKLGDLPGAWKYHGLAVDGLSFVVSSKRRGPILAELGVSLASDRPRLSIYVQEELLRGYAVSVSPGVRVGGIRRMAEAQYLEGNPVKALSLIRVAKRETGSASEPRVREALLGDLLALEGQIESETNPHRAVQLLTAAIDSSEKTEYRWQLVRLLLQKARSLRRVGLLELAESSLLRAIELIGSYGSSDDLMMPSFNEVRQIYQEMVLVQVLRGHPEAAFEFAERARAQILSLMAPPKIPPIPVFTMEQIQRELPYDAVLVDWWINGREIFCWVLRRDSFSFVPIAVDPNRLHIAVQKFRKAVYSDNIVHAGSIATWLYASLIAPIDSPLGTAKRLILVPDGTLSELPFAALKESPSSTYLIEQHMISVAPTASLYIHSLRRVREMVDLKLEVIALANPSFDRKVFGDLQSLPHSEEEAEQIVNAYPSGKLVVGPEVTRLRLVNELANWPVLHIGGHAVANSANPFTSTLVLAPSLLDSGTLYFRDLSRLRLERTRLAVFSACSTLRGESGSGVELAEPLLAQGVPAIVGTLWPVRDRHTGELTVRFHQKFCASQDAAMALREAQLELLLNPATREWSSVWAAFELIGAQ